jgi:hypothetical protein
MGAAPRRALASGLALLAGVLAAGLWVAGCASTGQSDGSDDQPRGYGVDFYEPFDNSRDYGPSYLVGPPNRAPLFPHDEGARSSGKTLQLLPPPNPVPSIPATPPKKDQPASTLPTSPVE